MWLYGRVEAFSGIAGVPCNLETTSTSNIHVLKLLATLAPWQLSDDYKEITTKGCLASASKIQQVYLSIFFSFHRFA